MAFEKQKYFTKKTRKTANRSSLFVATLMTYFNVKLYHG